MSVAVFRYVVGAGLSIVSHSAEGPDGFVLTRSGPADSCIASAVAGAVTTDPTDAIVTGALAVVAAALAIPSLHACVRVWIALGSST